MERKKRRKRIRTRGCSLWWNALLSRLSCRSGPSLAPMPKAVAPWSLFRDPFSRRPEAKLMLGSFRSCTCTYRFFHKRARVNSRCVDRCALVPLQARCEFYLSCRDNIYSSACMPLFSSICCCFLANWMDTWLWAPRCIDMVEPCIGMPGSDPI